jgi:hypothetical protein
MIKIKSSELIKIKNMRRVADQAAMTIRRFSKREGRSGKRPSFAGPRGGAKGVEVKKRSFDDQYRATTGPELNR